jgi:hypothetical protein
LSFPIHVIAMEFLYHTTGRTPDLASIERAIGDLDPAVLLDIDLSGRTVRISTSLGDDDLLACLRRADLQALPQDLERLPSVCCGGCGG